MQVRVKEYQKGESDMQFVTQQDEKVVLGRAYVKLLEALAHSSSKGFSFIG
jgi:hypothetical protein